MIDLRLRARLIELGSEARARLNSDATLVSTAQLLGVTREALVEALGEVRTEFHDPPDTTNALIGAGATLTPITARAVYEEAPVLTSLGLRERAPDGAVAPLSFRGSHTSVARFTSRIELNLQVSLADRDRLAGRLAELVTTAAFTSGADAWDLRLPATLANPVRVAVDLAGDDHSLRATGGALEAALKQEAHVTLEGPLVRQGPWANYAAAGGGATPSRGPGISDRGGNPAGAPYATRLTFAIPASGAALEAALKRLGEQVSNAGKRALTDAWDIVVLSARTPPARVGLELVGGQPNVQQARAAIAEAVRVDPELGAVPPTQIGEWGNYG